MTERRTIFGSDHCSPLRLTLDVQDDKVIAQCRDDANKRGIAVVLDRVDQIGLHAAGHLFPALSGMLLPIDLPDQGPDDWPDAPPPQLVEPPKESTTLGEGLFITAMLVLGLCVAGFAVIGFIDVSRDTLALVRSMLL